jgi:hypothetical protein
MVEVQRLAQLAPCLRRVSTYSSIDIFRVDESLKIPTRQVVQAQAPQWFSPLQAVPFPLQEQASHPGFRQGQERQRTWLRFDRSRERPESQSSRLICLQRGDCDLSKTQGAALTQNRVRRLERVRRSALQKRQAHPRNQDALLLGFLNAFLPTRCTRLISLLCLGRVVALT